MIETALYFALGALSTSLLFFIVIPLVSRRARRLAVSDLERQAPVTLAEITAQKDQMRARFAVEMNRTEQLANQSVEKMHLALIDAEKWRVRAEHAELGLDKQQDDIGEIQKKLTRTELELQQQKEIADKALRAPSAKDQKRLLELETEVDQLRAEKSTAKLKQVSIQTELSNAQAKLAELERRVPAAEELSLRKELKVLAMDVSNYVRGKSPVVDWDMTGEAPAPRINGKSETKPTSRPRPQKPESAPFAGLASAGLNGNSKPQHQPQIGTQSAEIGITNITETHVDTTLSSATPITPTDKVIAEIKPVSNSENTGDAKDRTEENNGDATKREPKTIVLQSPKVANAANEVAESEEKNGNEIGDGIEDGSTTPSAKRPEIAATPQDPDAAKKVVDLEDRISSLRKEAASR